MKQNVAGQTIGVQMSTVSDGSVFNGATTVYVTGDDGTQAIGGTSSGVCVSKNNGAHTYEPTAAETNYAHVLFTFIGPGAVAQSLNVYTTFPQSGDSFADIATMQGDVTSILADTGELQLDDIPGKIAALDAVVDTVKDETALILADTNELQLDDIPGKIATLDAVVDTVKDETALIVGDTSNLYANQGSWLTVTNFATPTNIIAGTMTTVTNLTNAPTAGDLTAVMKASIKTQADTALSDIHLNQLLAANYDPASKPGEATALLNELVESNAGVSRYTAASLAQAPSGTGASADTIANAVWDEAQADHVDANSFGALATEIATMQGNVTDILTDTGITKGDAALILADTNELQLDDIPGKIAALDIVVDSLTADVAAIPTTPMRGTENAATATALTTVDNEIAALQGNVTDILADTNELQTDDIPGKIAALDIVVDTVKAETVLILEDTNELQLDDIPGKIATLDAVVDTVKDDTALILVDTGELQVDDIPGKIAALDAVVDTVKDDTALILLDTGELQVDDIPGKIAALDIIVDTVKAETALILEDTVELQKGIIYGVAQGSPTSETCPTNLTAYGDDQLIGRVLIVTSGVCDGEATDITDYALATGLLTFTALTTNMSAADTFKIV